MRKSSEPIHYSQIQESPISQVMHASHQSMIALTPRNEYEERKSFEQSSHHHLQQNPDTVLAYQLRQSNLFSGDYNAHSDSYVNSSIVDARAPISTWKEDFMMTANYDINNMSHVPEDNHATQLSSAFIPKEFKILDDHI